MATKAVPAMRVQLFRLPRFFFPAVSAVVATCVFVGFARTYYLKEIFHTPSLPLLLHVHGFVMTCWLALLVTQTALVARDRSDIHRRLGVFGGVLAGAIVVIGVGVAIYAVRTHRPPPPGMTPLGFLTIPLGDIAVFATLVTAGLYYRRQPELHKRLMIVASISITPAGFARWPWTFLHRQPAHFFGATDLLLLSVIAFDYVRTRRLSPAYLWGGLLLIASHPLRLMLANTSVWQIFGHWITGV